MRALILSLVATVAIVQGLACSGAVGTSGTGGGISVGPKPTASSSPPLQVVQPSGHILIATPNGYLKVFDAKKVADGVGVNAENASQAIHLCGNRVQFDLSSNRQLAFAVCSNEGDGGTPNSNDSMASNNVSVSIIDISNLSQSKILKSTHGGGGLALTNPVAISMSPNGRILLVVDGTGFLHQFDANLQFVQSISLSTVLLPSRLGWSSDGFTAFLPRTQRVDKIRFGAPSSAPSPQPQATTLSAAGASTISLIDLSHYTIESLNSKKELGAIALQKIGIEDVFGVAGMLNGTVTPVTSAQVWDNEAIVVGNYAPYPNGPGPIDIRSHPAQKQFYAANLQQGTVSVVNVAYHNHQPKLSKTQDINVGCNRPQRIAFIQDGSYAFVACDHNISTIDAKAGAYLRRSDAALYGAGSTEWVPQ